MRKEEYRLNLWKEFMECRSYIPLGSQETLGLIAGCYVQDQEFLLRVYSAFVNQDRYLEDERNEVYYARDGQEYTLAYQGEECIFERNEFQKVWAGMLDIFEDTLPLGSVVDLKKSAYENVEQVQNVEQIRMVITHRFLGSKEGACYFPYAGVVYPTGMLGRKEVLHFTRPLVDRVVQRGYTDQQEEAFVYLMKRELVVEKGKCSYGFAPEEVLMKSQMGKGGSGDAG